MKFAEVEGSDSTQVTERSAAPGQTAGHYAPRTPLKLIRAWEGGIYGDPAAERRDGFLGFRADRPPGRNTFAAVEYLSDNGDLREAATRLFASLRRLDEAGLERILAEPVPEEGLGRAIMDRLRRAAAGSGLA